MGRRFYEIRQEEWQAPDYGALITLSADRKTLTFKFEVDALLKQIDKPLLVVAPENYSTLDASLSHAMRFIVNFVRQERDDPPMTREEFEASRN